MLSIYLAIYHSVVAIEIMKWRLFIVLFPSFKIKASPRLSNSRVYV